MPYCREISDNITPRGYDKKTPSRAAQTSLHNHKEPSPKTHNYSVFACGCAGYWLEMMKSLTTIMPGWPYSADLNKSHPYKEFHTYHPDWHSCQQQYRSFAILEVACCKVHWQVGWALFPQSFFHTDWPDTWKKLWGIIGIRLRKK